MKSGFRIFWTEIALIEFEDTIIYLQQNWTEREIKNLAVEIEKTLALISSNPEIFQISDSKKDIRRAVVAKLNNMYYRVNSETVEILSFYSNRKNPNKRRL
jgi:plasmid stabilization system protein ParE